MPTARSAYVKAACAKSFPMQGREEGAGLVGQAGQAGASQSSGTLSSCRAAAAPAPLREARNPTSRVGWRARCSVSPSPRGQEAPGKGSTAAGCRGTRKGAPARVCLRRRLRLAWDSHVFHRSRGRLSPSTRGSSATTCPWSRDHINVCPAPRARPRPMACSGSCAFCPIVVTINDRM